MYRYIMVNRWAVPMRHKDGDWLQWSDYEQDRRAKLLAAQDATDELDRIARDLIPDAYIARNAIDRVREKLAEVFGFALREDVDSSDRTRDLAIEHEVDKAVERLR